MSKLEPSVTDAAVEAAARKLDPDVWELLDANPAAGERVRVRSLDRAQGVLEAAVPHMFPYRDGGAVPARLSVVEVEGTVREAARSLGLLDRAGVAPVTVEVSGVFLWRLLRVVSGLRLDWADGKVPVDDLRRKGLREGVRKRVAQVLQGKAPIRFTEEPAGDGRHIMTRAEMITLSADVLEPGTVVK